MGEVSVQPIHDVEAGGMKRLKVASLWSPDFAGANDKRGKYGIYSETAIKMLLHYECSRADREGSVLSLVLFPLMKGEGENRELTRVLKRHSRLSDHLGWYDGRTLCVLLPNTELDRAEQFARKIQSGCEAADAVDHDGRLPYTLYWYPGAARTADGERVSHSVGERSMLRVESESSGKEERELSSEVG
jgi:hypothetical protein